MSATYRTGDPAPKNGKWRSFPGGDLHRQQPLAEMPCEQKAGDTDVAMLPAIYHFQE